jgi:hypothetical protein
VPAIALCVLFALVPGERLEYDVRLGPLRLGRLELSTLEPAVVLGESCRHFHADLDIRLGFLFRGRYRLDSWSRSEDLATIRSAKETEESRYRASWSADYDYPCGEVRYSDGDTFVLSGPAHDLLTLWYLFRKRELRPGDTARVVCHADRRTQQVSVAAGQSTEVNVPAGEFECLELTPIAAGPLGSVWLAEDSARTPVRIRLRTGSLEVDALLVRSDQGR